ncbi:MAG TPA: M20/M25/M40 family metallo-hydrolase [Thermomicrobiales bacterium]|nr:M20/M25/M40 family metallo-hydrolase [Thermomicrobiales bacterium]
MNDDSRTFLLRLLETASPSGFETEASTVWRGEAATFADEVTVDSTGTAYARLVGDGPKVMIEGHIDEIGIMISHIDDDGFCWFQPIGGWDDQVLVGQRIRILGAGGPVVGVIGKKPRHQLSDDDMNKVSKIRTLWIDIGAADGDAARARVSIGDAGVIEQPVLLMGDGLIACRGIDNRVGAFVALEALRLLASADRPRADVWAVAATQEEITFGGARTSAHALDPDVAIVIDVTHATDHPDADVRGNGLCKLGGGPALARGSAVHTGVHRMLVEAATNASIPHVIEATPRRTGTDADAIAYARAGVPTGIVSVPNRYMHSPSEIVSLSDLDNCAAVIAAFTRALGTAPDFPR